MSAGASAIRSVDVRQGRWIGRYLAALLGGFVPLYLLTRSSILVGDSQAFVDLTRAGDPAPLHYGDASHFLQVPLARALWRVLEAFGLPVSVEVIFVGLSLVGTLAAIVFVGLITAEILRTRTAAWLAAILFGTSLNIWTQWNGELYGLALGFVTAGLLFTLRGRIVAPALLWALAVLSHSEFVLAAPAFVLAIWMTEPDDVVTGQKLRRASWLLGLAAVSTLLVLLPGSWALGKWFDATSLIRWVWESFENRRGYGSPEIEVLRAIKGLVTAYTVAGHFWRDIFTGRGASSNPVFVLASAIGLLVLVLTGVLVAVAGLQRRLVLFALAWLLPFHVLVNWWFMPTVEKYHAGAVPGVILLVTGGLLHLAARLPVRRRFVLYAAYVVACAGLNLFGAVLPMQALGRNTAEAEREIRQLDDARGGRAVFVACDDPRAIVRTRVTFLRLRSVWTGTVPEIQETIRSWIRQRLRDGKEPYLVGRWCFPEEWKTKSSQAPFDMFFLAHSFQMVPTRITGIPITDSVPTNPFNWRRGDIVRLESRDGSQ